MGGFEILLHYGDRVVQGFWTPYGHVVSAWVLFWVFTLSGIAKIRDPRGAASAILNFGAARRTDARLGLLLGVAELGLAAGLAFVALRSYFLVVASVTLWIFVGLITRSLQLKRTFACFCFGDPGEELSLRTLARTLVLALTATGAMFYLPNGVAPTTVSVEVLAATVGLATIGVWGLLGRIRLLASTDKTELVTP